MTRNPRRLFVMSALAAAVAVPSMAVHAAPALEEIIVSARKTDEALQSVPIAVSAYNATDMAAMNMSSSADLGRFTPSVFIEPPAGGNATSAKVTIRGQQQSDSLITLDPSIGWYLDDVYLARAYGTVSSLFDAERMEVLKGPQGTLYGRNTTGGAIKIVTTKAEPNGDLSGYLTGGIGNYNERKISGAINIPIVKDVLAVRLAAIKDKSDGYGRVEVFDNTGPLSPNFNPANAFASQGTKDSGYHDNYMYRGNVTFTPTPDLDVYLGYEHSRTDITTVQRNIGPGGDGTGATLGSASTLGLVTIAPSTDFYKSKLSTVPESIAKTDTANLTVSYDINEDLATKLVYGWRRVDSTYDSDIDGTAAPINDFATRSAQWAKQQSLEWQLSGTAAQDKLEWITGLYYFEETGWDENVSYGALTGFGEKVGYGQADKNTSKSAFVNTVLHLTDKVDFNGGLRYSKDSKPLLKNVAFTTAHIDPATSAVLAPGCILDPVTAPNYNAADCTSKATDEFEFISWSAGFDYHITDDVLTYIKSAKASRSGGENVRGVDAATSAPFKPESATDIELGVKSQFLDNRVRLNADYYHTFYKDIQQSVLLSSSAGLLTQVVNSAKADLDGFEFELTALLTDNLTLTATGSLLNWKFDDSDSILSSAPGQQYSVRLAYDIPLDFGKIDLSANYSYTSSYDANAGGVPALGPFPALSSRDVVRVDDAATVDAVGLVSGRASIDFDRWGLNLALWGNNLTDKKYTAAPLIVYFPAAGLNIANATVGEPRMFGLDVTKTF